MTDSAIDSGLYPGNYFDYDDDEVAKQREFEIASDIQEGSYYIDSAFPADGRSLYFDPLNPPKGALPSRNIKWYRISEGDITGCQSPTVFKRTGKSAIIRQGSLGDGYFLNSLRLMTCKPEYLQRLIVSDKYAMRGIYTFKFCKAGKWRYVHVDDRIPCRPSGCVNFCRNEDPNETFSMLIEKAYAKLHGCYEALAFGLIEKTFTDLTFAGHTRVLRAEKIAADEACDVTWECLEASLAENKMVGCGRFLADPYGENASDRQGISINHLYQVVDVVAASAEASAEFDALTVGMVCIRNLQRKRGRFLGRWTYGHKLWGQYKEIGAFLHDRTKEILFKFSAEQRQGQRPNTTGTMEQSTTTSSTVIAEGGERNGTATATAQLTSRTAQTAQLTNRTARASVISTANESQQFSTGNGSSSSRGGVPPQPSTSRYSNASNVNNGTDFVEDGEERGDDGDDDGDDVGLSMKQVFLQHKGILPVQPDEEDYFWIQIEDFVEMFNRTYIVTDYTMLHEKTAVKRYLSKWIPDDYISGAVGPPVFLTKVALAEASKEEADDEKEGNSSVGGMSLLSEYRGYGDGNEHRGRENNGANEGREIDRGRERGRERGGGGEGEDGSVGSLLSDMDDGDGDIPAYPRTMKTKGEGNKKNRNVRGNDNGDGTGGDGGGDDDDDNGSGEGGEEGEGGGVKKEADDPLSSLLDASQGRLNLMFPDAPMYPISISEPTTLCITVHQPDRRWSVSRLGEDPRSVLLANFSTRGVRLKACMKYPLALGFVVLKLSGAKMRVTSFKLRKIVAGSDAVEFSSSCSGLVALGPGRYAVVPYVHTPLWMTHEYVLTCVHRSDQVELEVQDLLAEKRLDEVLSEDGDTAATANYSANNSTSANKANNVKNNAGKFYDDELDELEEIVNGQPVGRQVRQDELKRWHIPSLQTVRSWEYTEDIDELAVASLFDEVGSLAKYVRSLKSEVQKLNHTLTSVAAANKH